MAYSESARSRWPAGTPYGLGGQWKPSGVNTMAEYRAWLRKNGEPLPEGMPASGDPSKPTRGSDAEKEQNGQPNKTYGSVNNPKKASKDAGGFLENQIAKDERLRPYEAALNKALAFLKNVDDDFANDFLARIPLHLRGEAKMALAKALEARGFKIAYTTYEDGSKAPTGITSRPASEKGRKMMKARR